MLHFVSSMGITVSFAPDANRPDEIGTMLVDYGIYQYILYSTVRCFSPLYTVTTIYMRGTDLGHANVRWADIVKRGLAYAKALILSTCLHPFQWECQAKLPIPTTNRHRHNIGPGFFRQYRGQQ